MASRWKGHETRTDASRCTATALRLRLPLVVILAVLMGAARLVEAAAPAGEWWSAIHRYRKKITISGSTGGYNLYSIKLQFDHAALVAAGQSLASGDDVRVAYWDGSGWMELDRRVDDQSSWNSPATEIWFRTETSVAGTDDNYYLYYGNAGAGAPPTDGANVFLFYDDFEDASFDTGLWSCLPPAGCTEAAGELSLGANTRLLATAAYGVDTRWEGRVRLGGDGTEVYFNYFGASDANTYANDWVTFWTNATQHLWQNANATSQDTGTWANPSPTSYHVYSFDRETGPNDVRYYQDGTEIPSGNVAGTVPNANLQVFIWNDYPFNGGVVLDWVRVYQHVDPTPTAAVAGPEVASATTSGVPGCIVTTAIGTGDDIGYSVAVQADGKVVLSGYFDGPADRDFVALRYNADLRLDTSFDGDGAATLDIYGHDEAEGLVIQPADGKIVLGGRDNMWGLFPGDDDYVLARFNPDGSLDTATFNPTGAFSDTPPAVSSGKVVKQVGPVWDLGRAVALQPDGKILLAGYVDDGSAFPLGGNYDFGLVRYNVDGSLDTTFNPAGTYGIFPNTPGMVVTSVSPGHDYGNWVVVQPDGKILVAGATWNGSDWDWAIVRYNPDGGPDDGSGSDTGPPGPDFNPTGAFGSAPNTPGMVVTDLRGGDDWGSSIALQPDGKIVFGSKSSNGADNDFAVARYNADGSLDDGGPSDFTPADAFNPGGAFGDPPNTAGMVFTSIGPGADEGETMALQADGKILLAGSTWNGTDEDFAVVRYNADGSLDTLFGAGGTVVTPVGTGQDRVHGITVQPDGRILLVGDAVIGATLDVALARYNADGSLDSSCGVNYRSIGSLGPDSSGTVTATMGSDVVTGSAGITWRSDNRGRGDRIRIDGVDYTVLAVEAEDRLRLTIPYMGTGGPGLSYTIARQFGDLPSWETCIDGGPCAFFPVNSSSLVTDDRAEVGIAYDDVVGTDFAGGLVIDDSVTDAGHTITLTADGNNRHYGLRGQGVVINNGASVLPAVSVFDNFVTVEWMEITGGGGTADGIRVNLLSAGAGSLVQVRANLVRNVTGDGIAIYSADGRVDVINNILHGNTTGVWLNPTSLVAGSRFRILNNTFYNTGSGVAKAAGASAAATLLVRNNISVGNSFPDYSCDELDSADPLSRNNLSDDGTSAACSPAGGAVTSTVPAVSFVSTGVGSENLHLQSGSSAIDQGANLATDFYNDIDNEIRPTGAWDMGADEFDSTTDVELVSFDALPSDSAVELTWRTASELDNLGFHLHRSLSKLGPWTRITASLIPGLGSSPEGASYFFRDTGLLNGVEYFYYLEDIDSASVSTFHGPVSAVPGAGPPPEEEEPGEGAPPDEPSDTAEPQAYGNPGGGLSPRPLPNRHVPDSRALDPRLLRHRDRGRTPLLHTGLRRPFPPHRRRHPLQARRRRRPGGKDRPHRLGPPREDPHLRRPRPRRGGRGRDDRRMGRHRPPRTPPPAPPKVQRGPPPRAPRPHRRRRLRRGEEEARPGAQPAALRHPDRRDAPQPQAPGQDRLRPPHDRQGDRLRLHRTLRARLGLEEGLEGPGLSPHPGKGPPRRLLQDALPHGKKADPPQEAPPEPPGTPRGLPRPAPEKGLPEGQRPLLLRLHRGLLDRVLPGDDLRPGGGPGRGPDEDGLRGSEGEEAGEPSPPGGLRDQPLLPGGPPPGPGHLAVGLHDRGDE